MTSLRILDVFEKKFTFACFMHESCFFDRRSEITAMKYVVPTSFMAFPSQTAELSMGSKLFKWKISKSKNESWARKVRARASVCAMKRPLLARGQETSFSYYMK